jgi:PAS domain S-box-containing protein
METAFRLRDVVVPYLLSAVAIDVDGEARSVLAARDMTQIKESERELRKAQQRLCAQVEELTVTEARLRAEVRGSETAERLAQEREATLRKIFEASLDCITIRRLRDGRFLDVNKEFLRTIGYSREEVLGRTAEELGGWADPAQFAEYSRKVRTDGRARNMEADFRVKSGHVVPGLISAEVVELGGEPCVVSVMRDISAIRAMGRDLIAAREVLSAEVRDLEESRQRLSDSEAKLRKVLEATGDAITINRLSDGRYLDLNQGFCDVTGYTREEVLGRSAGDLGNWAHRV